MGFLDRLKKKPKGSFDIYSEEVIHEFVHNPDSFVLEMLKAEGKPSLPVSMGNIGMKFLDRDDGTSFTTTIKQYVEMKERVMAEKELLQKMEKTHVEWIRLAHGCSLDEAKQIVYDLDNGIDSDILRKYGIGHK